jgi:peptide deformylase
MKLKIIPNEQTPKLENYKSVDKLLAEDMKLLEKFISFCQGRKDCVGLASNQIAVDGKRITEPFFTVKDRNGWEIFIHPKILKYDGNCFDREEGCLTWQGKTILAKRYGAVLIQYYNLRGELIERTASGYEAQIIQHEMNHLLGVEEKFKEKRE